MLLAAAVCALTNIYCLAAVYCWIVLPGNVSPIAHFLHSFEESFEDFVATKSGRISDDAMVLGLQPVDSDDVPDAVPDERGSSRCLLHWRSQS